MEDNFQRIRPKAELVLRNIGQLVSLAGNSSSPVSQPSRETLGIIEGKGRDLCVASSQGQIVFIGRGSDLSTRIEITSAVELDCKESLVTPGFVDSHTHAIFAGSREKELEMKLEGLSYVEILKAGGGILKTVKETLDASDDQLIYSTKDRLDRMISFGTTTFEVKSGYALTAGGEIRLLELLQILSREKGYDIVPTLLSAHAIPKEYSRRNDAYIAEVVVPSIVVSAERRLASFCDVFVEEGAFTAADGRRIFEHAKRCGMKIKVHADEFSDTGGARLASEMGAVSADHLGRASLDGIKRLARSSTIAVLLPGTLFSSFGGSYAKAREMIEYGVPVAIATDLSPNSWIESMQFIISLACYGMRLTPEEAITGATINGAHAISRGAEVGSLEVGKLCDALIFNLKNYTEIPYRIGGNSLRCVVKKGRIISGNE